jgi:hypothetical protein
LFVGFSFFQNNKKKKTNIYGKFVILYCDLLTLMMKTFRLKLNLAFQTFSEVIQRMTLEQRKKTDFKKSIKLICFANNSTQLD